MISPFFKKERLFNYEGKELCVLSSYKDGRYTSWFKGDKTFFKTGSNPYESVNRLLDQRRKNDGKRTQARYIQPSYKEMKRVRGIQPANDPKPIALIKKKARTFDKPVKYTVRSLAKYAPARAPQHRRGPPTTSKIT